jgi:hypothetical protein
MSRYVPRLEQFLQALERMEARIDERKGPDGVPLSVRMRDSWATGRFWVDYGIRKSLDIDEVYWAALHEEGDDVLDDEMRKKMEKFVDMKMEQLRAYDAECKARFSLWGLIQPASSAPFPEAQDRFFARLFTA